ncbi:MAG TPA: Wzz/FepE/Etk N-terminal domain-containing protein [Burkholderiales bacterium]|nr:Wzz/FepE/Etk N-terminal domain-containing protein [Burkholderiales bacterium]
MDLSQFLLALRARRKAFVIAFAVTVLTAIAVALILPKKYVATATLLVDTRDEQTMSPVRMTARERAGYLQTQVDLLKSNRVATQVARDLKLAQKPGVREAWEKDTGGAGLIEEWIAADLLKNIVVDTSVSSFLLVNYPSDDPRFAAEVANGFTKAYLDMVLYLRTEPTREAAVWFDQQLKALRTQVAQAQTKLNAYQKEKGILVEDARIDVESARLSELSTQLLAARNATYDAVSRYKQATEILASDASPEAIPDVLANPHIISIKTALGAVEARRAQESTVLGENHPQYLRTAAEVQGLREKLQVEVKKVVAALSNAVEQQKKRERELQAALEAQNQRLLTVKDFRIDISAMTRDIENAQRSYDTVLARYMTNKIDATANKANVMLLAPAIEPLKPLHPKVGLISGLAVILGAVLAAALVYVFEMLDRRVRSRSDLESRLAVPSLGLLSKWQPTGGRLLPAPIPSGARAARALPHPW